MNKLFCIAAVIFAVGVQTSAGPVNIFGKVTDTTTGAALDSVIVKLAGQPALVDTTGENGVFSLFGETAAILKGGVAGTGSTIRSIGANVNVIVSRKTRVSIEVFNLAGQCLARPFDKPVEPGAYRIPVGQFFAAQILFVRVNCGGDLRIIRMQGGMQQGAQTPYTGALSKQAPLVKISAAVTVDTLVFARSGYIMRKAAIVSYTPADSIHLTLKLMHTPRVMRKIAGGTFAMGIAGTVDTVHNVTVSGFYIDTTEVTQADYRAVMGRNPAIHSNNLKKPVENVTWFDAVLYCNAISKLEGIDTAYTYTSRRDTTTGACVDLGGIAVDIKKKAYRLPTEAEWEFACRGGTTTMFYWGNDSTTDTVSQYAWFLGNVTPNDSTTQPVASKKPNAYGLYDMSGNVWEWCTDQWVEYGSQAQTDPFVALTAGNKINLRGGDYIDPPGKIASGFHSGGKTMAAKQLPFFGFRVVIPPVYADSELSYMTMVGVTIAAAKDTQVNAWYDTTHIPLLMKYAGLKQAYRYKKFAPADSFTPGGAGYWATYFYPTKSDIDGMNASPEFTAAITEMIGHWTAGECSTKVAVNYQKIMSWIKTDYSGPLNYVTVVRAEFKAGKEAEINNWYNNTHIPLIMKYPGVKKAVRYQKMGASTDINAAAMTTYMACYYYPTKADQDSMATSQAWKGSGGVQENMDNETIDNEMTLGKSLKLEFLKAVIK
jgi:formylglycine-generating enzyme required for sulfatase activity